MGLLRSELLRARSRRLVAMLIVGCVVAIAFSIVIVGLKSTKPSPEQVTEAKAAYEGCLSGRYLRPRGLIPSGYDSLADFCIRNNENDTGTGIFIGHLADVIQGAATFTVLIGVVLAASLGGADWSAGSMSTLLTWEPRRIRVLLVRALVVSVFVFAITFAIQLLLAGAFIVVTELRGTVAALPFSFLSEVARSMVRVSSMAVALGLIALSIATVGRSTVAALGVLFGYLVLFEGVFAGFAHGIQDKLLVRAAGVVISRQPIVEYHETFNARGNVSISGAPTVILGIGEAWAVVGLYTVALLLLALLIFRSRDVN